MGEGSFKHYFDEINIAADSATFAPMYVNSNYPFAFPSSMFSYCFVIRKAKDSSYFKVEIHEKLSDNRYVFRYGTNTSPNNPLLVPSTYNQSVRYKPNNLFYRHIGSMNFFTWEPPLSNNSHLQGYILYLQKSGVVIDTSMPINIAQWDSIGFTDSSSISYSYSPRGEYFNIVAVYNEGKSDFLKGWSKLFRPMNINSIQLFEDFHNILSFHKTNGSLSITLTEPMPYNSLSVYSLSGRRLANFPYSGHSCIIWNASEQHIPIGLYLLRAEFPDRSVITQPFAVTR